MNPNTITASNRVYYKYIAINISE